MKQIFTLGLLAIIGFAFYNFLQYQSDQNSMDAVEELKKAVSESQTYNSPMKFPADREMSAEQIGSLIKYNLTNRYAGKIIKVTGIVKQTGIDDKNQYYILIPTTPSSFETKFIKCILHEYHEEFFDQISNGMKLTLKGKCFGQVLTTAVIKDCVIDCN